MSSTCKHNKIWITVGEGGQCLWCYQCGAIRINYGKWIKPTGKDGDNPFVEGA